MFSLEKRGFEDDPGDSQDDSPGASLSLNRPTGQNIRLAANTPTASVQKQGIREAVFCPKRFSGDGWRFLVAILTPSSPAALPQVNRTPSQILSSLWPATG
jgi:hypothetical protein